MTDDELNAIRERCVKATKLSPANIQEHAPEISNGQRYCPPVYCYGINSHADIRFHVHATADIPALLDEIDRLRAKLADYERWRHD